MSDRETEALRKAVETVTPDPALSRVHPAIVRSQSGASVDIDIEEGGPAPRASGVELVSGIPGVFFRVKGNTRLRIAYDNGDPRKRIATHFDMYPPQNIPDSPFPTPEIPVEEINFCDAGDLQGAARNTDPIAAGSLTWTPTPPAGGIPTGGVLTYTPFPSADDPSPMPTVWSVVGPVVITQVSPNPGGPVSMSLLGAIRNGSSIVKIGG